MIGMQFSKKEWIVMCLVSAWMAISVGSMCIKALEESVFAFLMGGVMGLGIGLTFALWEVLT